jgi:hypothetical protein
VRALSCAGSTAALSNASLHAARSQAVPGCRRQWIVAAGATMPGMRSGKRPGKADPDVNHLTTGSSTQHTRSLSRSISNGGVRRAVSGGRTARNSLPPAPSTPTARSALRRAEPISRSTRSPVLSPKTSAHRCPGSPPSVVLLSQLRTLRRRPGTRPDGQPGLRRRRRRDRSCAATTPLPAGGPEDCAGERTAAVVPCGCVRVG